MINNRVKLLTEDNPKGTAYMVSLCSNHFGSEPKRVKQFTLFLRFSHSAGNEDIYKANQVNALVGMTPKVYPTKVFPTDSL